jgi:hypothetical protein
MTTDVQDSTLTGLGFSTVLGRLTGVTSDGTPVVDFPGNDGDPVPARSTVTILTEATTSLPEVLLAFPAGPDRTPVIVGVIQAQPITPIPKIGRLEPRSPFEVSTDGRRLVLTAYSELHLVCGESSITLRRDGKVIIRGAHLLSRATVTNRIQGGSVQIN